MTDFRRWRYITLFRSWFKSSTKIEDFTRKYNRNDLIVNTKIKSISKPSETHINLSYQEEYGAAQSEWKSTVISVTKYVLTLCCVISNHRLPDKHKEEECGIVRLTDDPSRWACYYKDSRNCFFFDSLGLKTPLELQKYLKTITAQADTIILGNSLGAGLSRYPSICDHLTKQRKIVNCSLPGDRVENVMWRCIHFSIPSLYGQLY